LLLISHIFVLTDFGSETCLVFIQLSASPDVSLRTYPRVLRPGVVRALAARSLLSKLAAPAESLDFQRAAKQCKLSKVGGAFEKLVRIGYLDVMDPSASHTKDVVVRLHVAVIACNVVEERYLTRLSHFAKLLQNPVDRGQRYVGMPATHCLTDLVGTRMVLRSEEGAYDRESLGCDGNPPLATPRHEVAQSLS
jgi:hypothetical protein